MDEGQSLELAACTFFLDLYNSRRQNNFQIVTRRDKPDFFVQDNRTGNELGVEVMHLYHDSKEAQMVLGRRPNELHGIMTISGLIGKLNSDLLDKVERVTKYDFNDKMLLVVRVASPIFNKQDFDMFEDEISVPSPNNFAEIWLLFWDQATGTYSDLKQIQ